MGFTVIGALRASADGASAWPRHHSAALLQLLSRVFTETCVKGRITSHITSLHAKQATVGTRSGWEEPRLARRRRLPGEAGRQRLAQRAGVHAVGARVRRHAVQQLQQHLWGSNAHLLVTNKCTLVCMSRCKRNASCEVFRVLAVTFYRSGSYREGGWHTQGRSSTCRTKRVRRGQWGGPGAQQLLQPAM